MANYKEYVYQPIMYYNGEKTRLCKPDLNEYFKFTINSGDNSSFTLPLSGGYYRYAMREYDLLVDWGDGVEEVISGTSSVGHGVTHTYPSANTNYQITLRPNGDLDGWGGAFGFTFVLYGCDAVSNRAKIISLDSPLTKSMVMKETTTDHICDHMFYNCQNLTMGSEFNLPQDISGDIGDNFCYGMFYNCTSLTMNNVFQLPQGITSCGDYVFRTMFDNCTNLKLNDIIQLPQNITSIENSVCDNMFYRCTSITFGVQRFFGNLVLNQEQLNQENVFNQTFYGCTSITEECSANTIPQLSVIPSSNNNCFTGASDIARANCPVNWGGLLE